MTKPHNHFKYVRADEVAECWGVSDSLYRALWNKVVAVQKEIPNLEDYSPSDLIGFENLASHWDLLSEAEQEELNRLAAEGEER